jgi:excisionase family DNA binding protein
MSERELAGYRYMPGPAGLSVNASAAYISVSRATMYRILDSGEIASGLIGRRRIIRRMDLDAYLERLVESGITV